MLYLKKGVILNDKTHPRMFEVMYVVDKVLWHNYAVKECWVTSGNDGKHMVGSFHYKGRALDFRVKNWPMGKENAILAEIKRGLGAEFDCLLEYMGTPNAHLHIEYDPQS